MNKETWFIGGAVLLLAVLWHVKRAATRNVAADEDANEWAHFQELSNTSAARRAAIEPVTTMSLRNVVGLWSGFDTLGGSMSEFLGKKA